MTVLKKPTTLAADQGRGRRDKHLTTDISIILEHRPRDNFASPKQTAYLNTLRRAIGLERWNAAKTLLGIQTPGTHDLTTTEAGKLITIIKAALGGGAS